MPLCPPPPSVLCPAFPLPRPHSPSGLPLGRAGLQRLPDVAAECDSVDGLSVPLLRALAHSSLARMGPAICRPQPLFTWPGWFWLGRAAGAARALGCSACLCASLLVPSGSIFFWIPLLPVSPPQESGALPLHWLKAPPVSRLSPGEKPTVRDNISRLFFLPTFECTIPHYCQSTPPPSLGKGTKWRPG